MIFYAIICDFEHHRATSERNILTKMAQSGNFKDFIGLFFGPILRLNIGRRMKGRSENVTFGCFKSQMKNRPEQFIKIEWSSSQKVNIFYIGGKLFSSRR